MILGHLHDVFMCLGDNDENAQNAPEQWAGKEVGVVGEID